MLRRGLERQLFYIVWFNYLKLFYWGSVVSFENFVDSHGKGSCTLSVFVNPRALKQSELWTETPGNQHPQFRAWGSELPFFTLLTIELLELHAGINRAFSCLNYSFLLMNFMQAECEVRAEQAPRKSVASAVCISCGLQKVKAEAAVAGSVRIRRWQCLLQTCPSAVSPLCW